MNTTAPDVLAELDGLISGVRSGVRVPLGEIRSLESIRTRIAALVEAAKLARDFLAGETHGNATLLSDESMTTCPGCVAHIALSAALKAIGHG